MFDINRTHYSTAGSYLVWRKFNGRLCLESVRTGIRVPIYTVTCPENANIKLEPWTLEIKSNTLNMRTCMIGSRGVCISGHGKLRLESPDRGNVYNATFVAECGSALKICECASQEFNIIDISKGTIEIDCARELGSVKSDYINLTVIPDENGEYEFTIERTTDDISSIEPMSFNAHSRELRSEYEKWEASQNCVTQCERECSYVLWSNIVCPSQNYPTEGIVMSKSGMMNIWSWDNCFNALDLADKVPEMALHQFMLPYRHLDRLGRAPDSVAPEQNIYRMFVKPPVQGWIYRKMMEKNGYFARKDVISDVYFPMKRNTDWWLNFRGDTPCYYHGNDSGADNSTCFDKSEHIETPELLAFLSVQCELLSELAQKLSMHTDTRIYRMLSDELCEKAVTDYFDGRPFVRVANTREPHYCDSLLTLRMIVLGKRLPENIKNYIAHQIEHRFLCAAGVASEAPDSEHFVPDGYWRGAVWGPDQVFFVLSLRELGYNELADKIASNYKHAVEKYGISENHDPLTGKALRCKAYTWSANAYRII